MVKGRLQPHHAPTAAWLEEQRINRLQSIVEFATDRRLLIDHFDKVLNVTVVSPGDYGMVPQVEDVEKFRERLEGILIAIARHETVKLPSDEFLPLHVSVSESGVRYSSDDPKTEMPQDPIGMSKRWRVVENVLDERAWRVRICEWAKCRRVFVRRGRSDYCDLKHAAAAARARRKLKREKDAKEGETNE